MGNDGRNTIWFKVGALTLALGFLGFLMLQAGAGGCAHASTPIGAERAESGQSSQSPERVAEPTPASTPAAVTPATATKPSTTPAKPASGPPPGYFPGTKAAPMPWARDNAPAQQAAVPQK